MLRHSLYGWPAVSGSSGGARLSSLLSCSAMTSVWEDPFEARFCTIRNWTTLYGLETSDLFVRLIRERVVVTPGRLFCLCCTLHLPYQTCHVADQAVQRIHVLS